MSRRREHPRYEEFRDRILAESVAFTRDLDEARFREIARLLESAGPPDAEAVLGQRYTFVGWGLPGYRPSARRLARRNPGFRVQVARLPRGDVGRRGILFRYGFRVEAVSGPESVPFIFFLVDRRGREIPAAPSSEATARRLAVTGTAIPTTGGPIGGYLDAVVSAPDADDADPSTWVRALVPEIAERLFDFAESEYGAPWRAFMAGELVRSPINDRWADRFQITAAGSRGVFQSDLEVLTVTHAIPTVENPPRPAYVRGFVHEGARVSPHGAPYALPAPGSAWLRVEHARIQDGGTVTAGDSLVLYEKSADPSRDFVSGTWLTTFGSAVHPETALLLRAPDAPTTIPEGILLAGRSDFNWFHWFVEYLPRVLRIPEDIAPDVPLLVTGRVPATGREALAELSSRPVVEIDPATSQRVDLLHVTAPPVQVLDTPRAKWLDGLSIDLPALEAFRSALGVDSVDSEPRRRVFLTRRSGSRGIRNEAALEKIAAQRGFEVIDPSALSFAAQRELFSTTRVLVGASGAVMANYLLLRPGSRILALTSEQLADFVLPAALAAVAGADFSYLLGASVRSLAKSSERNAWMHTDFTVSPDHFREALDLLLREP